MKLSDKMKSIASKLTSRKGKIIGFAVLIFGSVVATSMTTLAWFNLSTKESTIQMVTGDINVEIRRICAYKYVYPFYKGSNEFVDYANTDEAVVKKFVLEDHVLEFGEDRVDDIEITSDDATISLGTKERGAFTTDISSATHSNVCVPAATLPATIYEPEFRYYLIGDGLFCGVDDSWALTNGYSFAYKGNATSENKAILNNVVVSAGSSFRLIEALKIRENDQDIYAYNYYPLTGIAEAKSPFRIIDNGNRIVCLRSGIYSFTHSGNQLKIELRTADGGQGKDISVIMNNSLDPTKISIDYAGSSQQQTLAQYLPTAIHSQNSMLVLDVELDFKNVNPITASLKIERTKSTNSDNSISNLQNTYSNTEAFQEDKSTLRASDFYNFYAKFTKVPYATGSAIWDGEHNGMHIVGNSNFAKFTSAYHDYDRETACQLLPKEQSDSLIILPSQTDYIYHCYIAIEYDYEHCMFFLDKNRLGKTYYLNRDFTFHIYGTQYNESQSSSSQSSQSSEESQGQCMKKNRLFPILYLALTGLLVSTIALSVGITVALYEKAVQGNGTYGEVSLRSYYERGSGTKEDPFVITRPRHLYNLSRLQGLGVYGEKTYFELGLKGLNGDTSGLHMCYLNDYTTRDVVPYLDMSGSNLSTNPINAIGSEALPFYGVFEGNFVEIKGLNVYASPEDAGLFGYTAHGSFVQNLFLSDITIHATGYTDEYNTLYGAVPLVPVEGQEGTFEPDPVISAIRTVSFSYNPNNGSPAKTLSEGYANTEFVYIYADENFEYDPSSSDPLPTVTLNYPTNEYSYTPLLSGDLIKINNNGAIVPDTDRIFEFIGDEKNKEGGADYPIQASSSVSVILSSVDSYGQKHSRVLLTLDYNFTLENESATFIEMGVRVSGEHGNNIGLIAGHCDGTISHCYVYNGSFSMNDGGSGYNKIAMGSDLGLIGKVGGTVQNVLATESDVGAKEGKNIGVLDFTTIYSDIITSTSFNNSSAAVGIPDGITYQPNPTSKYEQYLRKYNNQYITKEENCVSFRGRSIITNTDLGVFTLPTDAITTGMYSSAGENLGASMVSSEDDLAIVDGNNNSNYYIYYSTGEYNKTYHTTHGASTFSNYLNSYNSDNYTSSSYHILPGYHVPGKEQFSKSSFETREARQNYFVRFKLEPSYRHGKGFYFSDLDTDTDGGAFFANYFSYKLVDQNGRHIPTGDNKCGIMLKNNLRQEVSSLSASFSLPKLTPDLGGSPSYAYCLEDENHNKYTSNMINFEIKTDLANITVIAAPEQPNTSAALGVYKFDDADFVGDISTYRMQFKQSYDDPDYAFFMPSDNHLAYFDYRINTQSSKGEIGVYSSNGTFTVATKETNATVPTAYGIPGNEYGYTAGKTRLFAHTFCLPRGRYCLGSASSASQSLPKIYYMCAQGQDDGQFDFDDTAFASKDTVENIDFLNTARFDENGQPQIMIAFDENDELIDISSYNPNSQTEGNYLGNHRLYVALVNSDRSLFGDTIASDLSFIYPTTGTNAGKFVISSTLTGQSLTQGILHVAVDNYKPSITGGTNKTLTIVLLGRESSGEVFAYPFGD